jgi:serine O-acetyltransferase
MNSEFLNRLYIAQQACPTCPSQKELISFFEEVLGALFPDFSQRKFNGPQDFQHHMQKLQLELEQLLVRNPFQNEKEVSEVSDNFFEGLPQLHQKLEQDVTGIFEGDPAAKSRTEVISTYPGFYAIAAHRIAHELDKQGVDLLPRIISEYAHSKTGIDIHPAATIGSFFCIDHGTGVVIGETTIIGDHVKIYQGVTLGALSVDKKDAKTKRHPTIENNVVVYAGATILGGKTEVGHDSIIGGNVWLTRSVPSYSKVYYQAKMNNDQGEIDTIIFKEPNA